MYEDIFNILNKQYCVVNNLPRCGILYIYYIILYFIFTATDTDTSGP